MDGQGTKRRRKIAEDFNQLSRAHKRYRQTTDWRTGDSEREREFVNKSVPHEFTLATTSTAKPRWTADGRTDGQTDVQGQRVMN